jgi:hypothetical protein
MKQVSQPVVEDGKVFLYESTIGRCYVYFEEYNGVNMLHVRYWVHDKRNDNWMPGRKGIAIPEARVKIFFDGLKLLFALKQQQQPASDPYGS